MEPEGEEFLAGGQILGCCKGQVVIMGGQESYRGELMLGIRDNFDRYLQLIKRLKGDVFIALINFHFPQYHNFAYMSEKEKYVSELVSNEEGLPKHAEWAKDCSLNRWIIAIH